MIESMTGFGRADGSENGTTISIEARSVNNRFLEISLRAPTSVLQKEFEIKDLVKNKFERGKINLTVIIAKEKNSELKIDLDKAKNYFSLLKDLRKSLGVFESVKLAHVLQFSKIYDGEEKQDVTDEEWKLFIKTLNLVLIDLKKMRTDEGAALKIDLSKRISVINDSLSAIEKLSVEKIETQRNKLREKVASIISDSALINSQRIEMEILLLSDKLDVTEEIVRFKTHNNYFLKALEENSSQGRKLNFIIQEMNREANTIGSKSNDAEIAHLVVLVKEEVEKIREQLQNIE